MVKLAGVHKHDSEIIIEFLQKYSSDSFVKHVVNQPKVDEKNKRSDAVDMYHKKLDYERQMRAKQMADAKAAQRRKSPVGEP